jgi:peptidylprolyl isomerase
MVAAKQGDKVRVHYTGTLEDGSVFDSTEGQEPFEFTIGSGEVLPDFENAIVGLEPGDETEVKIISENAYGDYRDDLCFPVEKSYFPEGIEPKVGEFFSLQLKNGNTVVVKVKEIQNETIILDANHPLSGKDLNFKIKLVEIS